MQTRQLKYSKLWHEEVSPTEIKFPELLIQENRLVFLSWKKNLDKTHIYWLSGVVLKVTYCVILKNVYKSIHTYAPQYVHAIVVFALLGCKTKNYLMITMCHLIYFERFLIIVKR